MIKKVQGFSLVELLVSLAISVVFVGTAASLLSRNKTDYVPLRDSARMNEAAQTVLGVFEDEIRLAGYFGDNESMKQHDYVGLGAATRFQNHMFNLNAPNNYLYGITRRRVGVNNDRNNRSPGTPVSTAVEGFEGNAPGSGFLPSGTLVFDDQTPLADADTGILPGTDALTIRGGHTGGVDIFNGGAAPVRSAGRGVKLAASIPPGGTTIPLEDGSALPENGYFIIYDNWSAELFKGVRNGNNLTLVADPRKTATVSGINLENAYTSLVGLGPGAPVNNGQAYVTVARFSRYYISNYVNADGEKIPSLYKESYDEEDDAIIRKEQVLIEGVENMQITYAETLDDVVGIDRYSTADQVANWENVKSVKISLLLRSDTQSSVDASTGSKTYRVNNEDVVPGTTDKYARKVYTTQITLDNTI